MDTAVTSAPTSSPQPTATASPEPSTAPVASTPVDTGSDQPAEIPRIGDSPEVLLSADPSEVRGTQPDTVQEVLGEPSGTPRETTDANLNWMEKFEISQELRDNPNISKYNTLEDALNANVNLVKKLGEKGIMKPDDNADADTWAKWYDHVGRPQTPDGYTDFQAPTETDADGKSHALYELDKGLYSDAKKAFHEAGLDQRQHDAMMKFFTDYEIAKTNQEVAYNADQATQVRAQLEKEWGGETKANIQTAVNVAQKLDIMDTIVEKGLASDLSVIKMLHTLSSKIGEAKLTGDVSSHGGGFESTLAEIQSNPAYRDKSHPDYHRLHQREIQLYSKRYN